MMHAFSGYTVESLIMHRIPSPRLCIVNNSTVFLRLVDDQSLILDRKKNPRMTEAVNRCQRCQCDAHATIVTRGTYQTQNPTNFADATEAHHMPRAQLSNQLFK